MARHLTQRPAEELRSLHDLCCFTRRFFQTHHKKISRLISAHQSWLVRATLIEQLPAHCWMANLAPVLNDGAPHRSMQRSSVVSYRNWLLRGHLMWLIFILHHTYYDKCCWLIIIVSYARSSDFRFARGMTAVSLRHESITVRFNNKHIVYSFWIISSDWWKTIKGTDRTHTLPNKFTLIWTYSAVWLKSFDFNNQHFEHNN